MFRIVASSTISFGLGYMCATYGKLESPDGFAKPKTVQNLDSCKDKETEKALYNKYGIKYDDNGRAIYYGAP